MRRHIRIWRKLTGWHGRSSDRNSASGHPQGAVWPGLGREDRQQGERHRACHHPCSPECEWRDRAQGPPQGACAFSLRTTRPATRLAIGRSGRSHSLARGKHGLGSTTPDLAAFANAAAIRYYDLNDVYLSGLAAYGAGASRPPDTTDRLAESGKR